MFFMIFLFEFWMLFLMYFATVFWIIGYDTIYGCQDKNEDEILGIKNSAVSAKNFLTLFVGCAYSLMFALLILSGYWLSNNIFWYIGVSICGFHLIYQVIKIKDIEKNNPLKIFKSNVLIGLILTLSSLGNHIKF